MMLSLIFFFLVSLLVASAIPKHYRRAVFVLISIIFFILTNESREVIMYSALIASNILLLLFLSKTPIKKFKFLVFFPLIYAFGLISLNHSHFSARVFGWSYIVLAASAHLYEVLVGDRVSFRSWIKEHIFLVMSYPKTSMGPIDLGRNLPDIHGSWDKGGLRFLKGLLKVGILLYVFRTYIPKPVIDDAQRFLVVPYFLLGLWHYVNLYLEFSGVIDLVLGIFLVWGIELKENFRSPWGAVTIADFWRRWHMTLGSWIMQYVYIPLGGNRKGFVRQVLNLICAMILCGLWHGATKNFILWGAVQGVGLSAEKIMKHFDIGYERMPQVITWTITQVFVVFSWVIFFNWK
ncbi:Peptidoglycan O-acetyltransferase [compost metagenome]